MQKQFTNNEKDSSFNAYISLIDQALSNACSKKPINSPMHSRCRTEFFKSIGLLRQKNEISNDLFQLTILEKCMLS